MEESTKQAISVHIKSLVRDSVTRNLKGGTGDYNPFRSRLISDSFWRIPKFERSFITSMGSRGYEELGKIIAEGAGHIAIRSHILDASIEDSQLAYIDRAMSSLRANRSKPDWEAEKEGILAAATGGETQEIRVISDLYVRTQDSTEKFYTMKTVKPNLDQTEKAKSDCVKVVAANPEYQPYFALPYNPYGEERALYNWTHPSRIF